MKPIQQLKEFLSVFRHDSKKEELPEEAYFVFSDAVYPQREKIITYSKLKERLEKFLGEQKDNWIKENFKIIPFMFLYHAMHVIPSVEQELIDWFDIELNNYCTTHKISKS